MMMKLLLVEDATIYLILLQKLLEMIFKSHYQKILPMQKK